MDCPAETKVTPLSEMSFAELWAMREFCKIRGTDKFNVYMLQFSNQGYDKKVCDAAEKDSVWLFKLCDEVEFEMMCRAMKQFENHKAV